MKSQCSAPYVYGKEDLRLEHALGVIETAYARSLRKVIAGQKATGEDIGYLLAFMMLQFSRTKAAVERLRSMITGMEREIRSSTSGRLPEMDTSARAMMLSSLRLYETVAPAVLDLRPCFLKNRSRVEFVTSDDPVCFTSRFHARRDIQSFGIASAGVMFFMPLTPRLLLLCYDHNVYTVRRIGRFVETKSDRDVEACNELQYLNALENVYFGDWAQKAGIEARSAKLRERRPASRTRFTKYEEDGCSPGGMQRYRRMAPDEPMERDSMIIGASPVRVFPRGVAVEGQVPPKDEVRRRRDWRLSTSGNGDVATWFLSPTDCARSPFARVRRGSWRSYVVQFAVDAGTCVRRSW